MVAQGETSLVRAVDLCRLSALTPSVRSVAASQGGPEPLVWLCCSLVWCYLEGIVMSYHVREALIEKAVTAQRGGLYGGCQKVIQAIESVHKSILVFVVHVVCYGDNDMESLAQGSYSLSTQCLS